jgi:DNA mismatch repair ATPase MutS
VTVPRWYGIFPILTLATLTLIPVVFWRVDLLPALVGVLILSFVLQLVALKRIEAVSRAFRQIAPIVATGQSLRFLHGEDVDSIVAPIRHTTPDLLPLKTISRWISGDPFMLSVQPNPAAAMLADLIISIYDYLNLLIPVNAAGVYLGVARLRADAAALLDVMAALGDVDAAVSVASLRAGEALWTRPDFTAPGSSIAITEGIHPLVTNPVPNSVELRSGTGMLVTGSNMSGKSTFLRTLGVTAVMAHSLNTCFARAYCAPMFTVRSCIGRADDILQGKSYYLVEVEALLSMVRASTGDDPHLFLLDEMFRGTNAVERIAAGQSVLVELIAGGKPHVVVAATHDNELVDLLAGSYAPYHFGDALTDETLTFDYHLRAGRSTSRNAIALLRLNGASPELVQLALATAAELDRQRARISRL